MKVDDKKPEHEYQSVMDKHKQGALFMLSAISNSQMSATL